jgi:hypothetical protein
MTGPAQQRPIPDAALLGTRPVPRWSRLLAVVTAVIFCLSAVFPVVAGLSKNTGAFPKWWGIADVVLAFVLAAMVFAVMVAAQGKGSRQADDATYRAYRILIHGIFVMLVVFFLAGERITWINCLTGFAWRAWLLLYALPSWFTAVKAPAVPDGAGDVR